MKVLVVGGTGELGRVVVPLLRRRGHDVRVGTRTPREQGQVLVDLTEPATLVAAAGCDVVVHLAANPYALRAVDVDGTAALVEAVRRHEVGHLVLLSIVGIDDHPFPFYRARLAAERAVATADVPHSILRSTQFHTLVGRYLDELPTVPVVPVPRRVRLRPVAVGVVADRVVGIIESGPCGRAEDVVGPRVELLDDLVRQELGARGRRAALVPVPMWGAWDRGWRDGRLLGAEAGSGPTFAEHIGMVRHRRSTAVSS